MENSLLQQELTKQIIGLAYEVHNNLGPGFMEVIYQRALATELRKAEISFQREAWLDVYYKNQKVGKKRVDFVFSNVILEIKAKESLEDKDYIQTLSYLKASDYTVALLINFGGKSVQLKRMINT